MHTEQEKRRRKKERKEKRKRGCFLYICAVVIFGIYKETVSRVRILYPLLFAIKSLIVDQLGGS